MKTTAELWPKLEVLGEDVVRERLRDHVYGPDSEPIVRDWLKSKESQRAEAATGEQRDMDREALRLAKESNTIAEGANRIAQESNGLAARANRIAWFAVVVALAAALVALMHR